MKKTVYATITFMMLLLCFGLVGCDGVNSQSNYIEVSNEKVDSYSVGDTVFCDFICDIKNKTSQEIAVVILLYGTRNRITKRFTIEPNETKHCVVSSGGNISSSNLNTIVFDDNAEYQVYSIDGQRLE